MNYSLDYSWRLQKVNKVLELPDLKINANKPLITLQVNMVLELPETSKIKLKMNPI